MEPIDGTLIIAGVALVLAAIASGFALGAVINMRKMRRDLVDLIEREGDLAVAEIAAYSNRLDTAIRTANNARDASNSTAGVVDGLQRGADQMRETVAGLGLQLADADKRHADRNDALLAEIAPPLQGVQQRTLNLEHAVRNIEQSLALMVRAEEPASQSRATAGEQQAEARASSAPPPANEQVSSAPALVDETQAEEAPANAPPTSPSPAIDYDQLEANRHYGKTEIGPDFAYTRGVVSYHGGFRGGDMSAVDSSALNFNEKHEPPAGALPAWRW